MDYAELRQVESSGRGREWDWRRPLAQGRCRSASPPVPGSDRPLPRAPSGSSTPALAFTYPIISSCI